MTEAERQRLADDALWSEANAVIFPGLREHSENVSRESRNVSRELSRDGSPEMSHHGPPSSTWGSPKPMYHSSPKDVFRPPFQLPAHELRRQSVHLAQGGFGHVFRVEGLPSMVTFLQAATEPAIRTCNSVAARLRSTASSSQLAADLLRTSLTVQQQAANSQSLQQIQDTAKTQVLLQESVEGLSVVAITYYSTGVFGYLAKGASALGWLPVPLEVALAMSVPVLGSVAYMGLHRLKAGVMKANR